MICGYESSEGCGTQQECCCVYTPLDNTTAGKALDPEAHLNVHDRAAQYWDISFWGRSYTSEERHKGCVASGVYEFQSHKFISEGGKIICSYIIS